MKNEIVNKIQTSNLSIAKIAQISGVKSRTIEQWVYDGTMPTVDKAEAVLNSLGYSVEINKLKRGGRNE